MIYNNWNDIYKYNAPKLLGVCRRYISDISTAEDILHDSFIKAIEKSETYKGDGKIEAWLCKIVINTALSHIRKEKNFKLILSEELENQEIKEEELENDSQNFSLTDFTQEELLETIDQLPLHHKSVFNLYVIDGYSHIEISELLNITINTSKSHLMRARKKIQQILAEKQKKKRRIAGILIISNPTIIMEKFFKEKFKNFEVQPSKSFFIDTKEFHNAKFFATINQKSHYTNYIFLANFVLCLLAIFAFATITTIDKKNQNTIDKKITNRVQKIENFTTLAETKAKEKLNISAPTKEKVIISDKSKNEVTEVNNVQKPKINIPEKEIIDSVENSKPKTVIIKRKIIKRDTVYVEK